MYTRKLNAQLCIFALWLFGSLIPHRIVGIPMAWNRSQIHKYPNHTNTSVLPFENILKRSRTGFPKCNSETTPRGFTGSCTWQSHVVSPWWLHWRSPYGGHTAYLLRNCLQWPHKRDFLDKPDSEAKTQIVSHVIQQQMLQEISLQPDGMCHAPGWHKVREPGNRVPR